MKLKKKSASQVKTSRMNACRAAPAVINRKDQQHTTDGALCCFCGLSLKTGISHEGTGIFHSATRGSQRALFTPDAAAVCFDANTWLQGICSYTQVISPDATTECMLLSLRSAGGLPGA